MVLTPGPFSSAYFDHAFQARTMGLELVHAPDLFVEDEQVFVRTMRGRRRVQVIYRRTERGLPRDRGLPARQPPRGARPHARLFDGQRGARERSRERRRGRRRPCTWACPT